MSNKTIECPYAPRHSLVCEKGMCSKCGWNPEVAFARLEAIKQKMFEEGLKDGQVKAKA